VISRAQTGKEISKAPGSKKKPAKAFKTVKVKKNGKK
jgi:hypothetical protein